MTREEIKPGVHVSLVCSWREREREREKGGHHTHSHAYTRRHECWLSFMPKIFQICSPLAKSTERGPMPQSKACDVRDDSDSKRSDLSSPGSKLACIAGLIQEFWPPF